MRIPSIDQQSCELCGSYCRRCEYTSYDASIIDPKVRYPTRYSFTSNEVIQNKDVSEFK
jgi:hypothetical protein